jgi:hypothetical protein
MLLAGGDLIQSFSVPNLWKDKDVFFSFNPRLIASWKLMDA